MAGTAQLTPDSVLWTFQDAVERLLDVFQLAKTGRQYRLSREAVINCYRDLPSRHPWHYYRRRYAFQTDAQYATGTLTYDHTGGTSERLVTLSGGTWPTNAAYGMLKIGDDHWPVASRLSATTLQLDITSNPGADVAAGTTYTWYRDLYPLPVLCNRIGELCDASDNSFIGQVSPEEALIISRNYASSTAPSPSVFAIVQDPARFHRLCILLAPAPSAQVTYEFMQAASGAPLTVEKYSVGTITTEAASTTVLFNGGSLSSDQHLGAVLRVSGNAAHEPTSLRGTIAADNPYKYQRIITAITDSTHAVVDSSIAETLTAVKYTLSSPLDVEPGAMLTFFWRMCEREFCELLNLPTSDLNQRIGRETQAWLDAKDADRRTSTIETAHQYREADVGGTVLGSVDPSGD